MTGYASLLNIEAQPHWTIFLTDFPLPSRDVRRMRRQLATLDTRVLFLRVDRGLQPIVRRMRAAGVDFKNDYVSLHAIVSRDTKLAVPEELADRLRQKDFAKVDVPRVACGFRPSRASHLLDIVMRSDHIEQRDIARRFFDLLGRRDPYEVRIETRGGKQLTIRDNRAWFDLAGPLRRGEIRSLPSGEVAHSGGGNIDGEFVVDGAIYAVAQDSRFAAESLRLMRLSHEIGRHPFRLRVRQGEIFDVTGDGRMPLALARLFEKNDRYRRINEVGISFNGASSRFIHTWPAASNEVRPGVHLAIGGAANPDDATAMVHLDCMAANCAVIVNGRPFLYARDSARRRETRAAGRA
jgi:hypothetical protein